MNRKSPMKIYRIALCLTALSMFGGTNANAQNWAERLGYPSGQKVVLLDAREMGLGWEMNLAGQQLIESGVLQSVSAITTGPWFDGFAQYCRTHQIEDLGISIALTNPYKPLHWRLASGRTEVPSLVNQDGFPWRSPFQFAANATAADVEKEIHAQIQQARAAGLQISHISGYHGTVYSRPDTAKVFLDASRKYWLPCPVVELDAEDLARFQEDGLPLSSELIDLVKNYPLPKLDELYIIPNGNSYEEKRDRFIELLRTMPSGLSLIMFRPAVESDGVKMLSHDWQQRIWDAQLMSDELVHQAFKEQQIAFTNWREIMRRFEGIPVHTNEEDGTVEEGEPADVPIP